MEVFDYSAAILDGQQCDTLHKRRPCVTYVGIGKASERHGKLCLTFWLLYFLEAHCSADAMVPISRLLSVTVCYYELS